MRWLGRASFTVVLLGLDAVLEDWGIDHGNLPLVLRKIFADFESPAQRWRTGVSTGPGPGQKRTDAELVETTVHGQPDAARAAFAEIFARHHQKVLAYCSGRLQDPHAAADAAAETFVEALKDLADLRDPGKLPNWLIKIALNRCRDEWKRLRGTSVLPDPLMVEGTEDEADAYDRASRARHAQVDRMLDTVIATLTEKQKQTFNYAIREGLSGKDLATRLNTAPAQASRLSYEIITTAYAGFGALVLAKEGRRYCPVLADILDQAAFTADDNFTAVLRQRILRHLETCEECGTCSTCEKKKNCSTCREQKERLVAAYAPAVIPILVTSLLAQQFNEHINRRRPPRTPDDTGTPPQAEASPVETVVKPAARPASAPPGDQVSAIAAFRAGGEPSHTPAPSTETPGIQRTGRAATAHHGRIAAVVVGAMALIAGLLLAPRLFPNSSTHPAASGETLQPTRTPTNPAIVTEIAGNYTLVKDISKCTFVSCNQGPVVFQITCPSTGSCTVFPTTGLYPWGSPHTLSFDGTTIRASATDDSPTSCNGIPAPGTIDLNLTVVSWSVGPGSTRRPLRLQGTYTMTYYGVGGCGPAQLIESLTSP